MKIRLARAGQRSVSLAVDVTNYLMLELGQPLHAFDRARLTGRSWSGAPGRGRSWRRSTTWSATLDPEDILITDASGPISLAGTMGGVADRGVRVSHDLVIEAAHFSARGIARMSRRHRLGSEASARFERGVDPELPLRASAGPRSCWPGSAAARSCPAARWRRRRSRRSRSRWRRTTRTRSPAARVRAGGTCGGDCSRSAAPSPTRRPPPGTTHGGSGLTLVVTPPSWRPDLTDPADLAEEVIRLEGYQNIPVREARAAAGHGLTSRQRLRRTRAARWATTATSR